MRQKQTIHQNVTNKQYFFQSNLEDPLKYYSKHLKNKNGEYNQQFFKPTELIPYGSTTGHMISKKQFSKSQALHYQKKDIPCHVEKLHNLHVIPPYSLCRGI